MKLELNPPEMPDNGNRLRPALRSAANFIGNILVPIKLDHLDQMLGISDGLKEGAREDPIIKGAQHVGPVALHGIKAVVKRIDPRPSAYNARIEARDQKRREKMLRRYIKKG